MDPEQVSGSFPASTKSAIGYMKEYVKRRAMDASDIRKRINAAKGIDRHNLWNEKRAFGEDTRDCLLAYGCLRNKPYPIIEKRCAEGNEPVPSSVLAHICSFLGREGPEAELWTKERVKAWLKRPEPKEMSSEPKEAA